MHPGCSRRAVRRAFSLIELLVVIAVIAVLVSMLLPALGQARETSKTVKCLANLRSIGQGVMLYAGAYNDYYPLSSHTTKQVDAAWLQSLQPYGVTEQDRYCPTDPERTNTGRLTSFATNDHFEPLKAGFDYNAFTKQTLPGGRTRALNRVFLVPRPSTTAYVVEVAGTGTTDHIHSIGWTTASQFGAAIAVKRHRDAANYLFADGHADPIAWALIASTFRPDHNILDPEQAP